MSLLVTINTITANTPVDVYYCDAMSASCVFVSGITSSPFQFEVPSPYSDTDFVVKIVDSESCELGETFFVTPTPTSTITPTITQTPTQTITNTVTPSFTPSVSPTNTPTPSFTPTVTQTNTTTPLIVSHQVGKSFYTDITCACDDTLSINLFYTYISEAYLVPIIGTTLYKTNIGGVLYNPVNGDNKWIKIQFSNGIFAVQVSSDGVILNTYECVSFITPTTTQTPTNTPTVTPTGFAIYTYSTFCGDLVKNSDLSATSRSISEITYTVGTTIGTIQLNYSAIVTPDKFEVIWDGNVVASSGFASICYPSSCSFINSQLTAAGFPEGVTSASPGSISFYKSASTPTTVLVRITSPLYTSPSWDVILSCPQPTPTPTPTSTVTPTFTNTPTNTTTQTQTPTNTSTNTPTQTPSQTPTNTPTQTPTQTETQTPTQTPTQTETQTPTQTLTQTETQTQTPTQTETQTPTQTPTQTETQTPTQTPTETQTPTQTETQTPTQTPTQTETQTPTQTPTQTETQTQTPTNTSTNTPTPTITPTPTGTPSIASNYLLQEDGGQILQENGSNLLWD